MKLLKITKSDKPDKKMMAVFETDSGRTKTIHFGAIKNGVPMEDYTIHKDKERQKRYIERHSARENFDKPDTAGALSRYVLWSSTSLAGGIRNYKNKFGF